MEAEQLSFHQGLKEQEGRAQAAKAKQTHLTWRLRRSRLIQMVCPDGHGAPAPRQEAGGGRDKGEGGRARPGGACQDRAPRPSDFSPPKLRRSPSGPGPEVLSREAPAQGEQGGNRGTASAACPCGASSVPCARPGAGTQVQHRRSAQPFSLDAGCSVDTKSTILSPTRASDCPLFPWESWCDNTAFREEAPTIHCPRSSRWGLLSFHTSS